VPAKSDNNREKEEVQEQSALTLAPTTSNANGESVAEDLQLLTPSVIRIDTATPRVVTPGGSRKVSPRSVVPIEERVDDDQIRSSEPALVSLGRSGEGVR
jgi:hypothetical protein